jgi:hypothetical protein
VLFASAVASILALVPDTGSFLYTLLQSGDGGSITYLHVDQRDAVSAVNEARPVAPVHEQRARTLESGPAAVPSARRDSNAPIPEFEAQLSLARQYRGLSRNHSPQAVRAYLKAYDVASADVKAKVRPELVSEATRSYERGKFDLAARQLEQAFADVNLVNSRK